MCQLGSNGSTTGISRHTLDSGTSIGVAYMYYYYIDSSDGFLVENVDIVLDPTLSECFCCCVHELYLTAVNTELSLLNTLAAG